MSLLYPALLIAMAAVGLPILLHLIRRRVRDRVAFSSLRFVQATLPRLRNRRRLENLVLLVLRGLAVCLLALAFARPFVAAPAAPLPPQPARRIVVLVDTSGSMRRPGLWSQAVSEARSVLEGLGPLDRGCLMTFDQEARFLVGFEAWVALDPDQRVPAAARQLAALSPGWQATHLGQALVFAAEAIGDDDTGGRLAEHGSPTDRADQRSAAGQPAGGPGRLRMAEGGPGHPEADSKPGDDQRGHAACGGKRLCGRRSPG